MWPLCVMARGNSTNRNMRVIFICSISKVSSRVNQHFKSSIFDVAPGGWIYIFIYMIIFPLLFQTLICFKKQLCLDRSTAILNI